jgi:hypothetical protein
MSFSGLLFATTRVCVPSQGWQFNIAPDGGEAGFIAYTQSAFSMKIGHLLTVHSHHLLLGFAPSLYILTRAVLVGSHGFEQLSML